MDIKKTGHQDSYKSPEESEIKKESPSWIGAVFKRIGSWFSNDSVHEASSLKERTIHPLESVSDSASKQSEGAFAALRSTVLEGSAEEVSQILGGHPFTFFEINQKDEEGQTLLMRAISLQKEEVVALLLAQEEIDTGAVTLSGRTAVDFAEDVGNEKIIKSLVGFSIKLKRQLDNGEFGILPYLHEDLKGKLLHYATVSGNIAAMRCLVTQGISLNTLDKKGRSPLHNAILTNNLLMMRALIEEGASLQQEDKWGKTPLYYAVLETKREAVKLLLEKGAKVEEVESWDLSPLQPGQRYYIEYLKQQKSVEIPSVFQSFLPALPIEGSLANNILSGVIESICAIPNPSKLLQLPLWILLFLPTMNIDYLHTTFGVHDHLSPVLGSRMGEMSAIKHSAYTRALEAFGDRFYGSNDFRMILEKENMEQYILASKPYFEEYLATYEDFGYTALNSIRWNSEGRNFFEFTTWISKEQYGLSPIRDKIVSNDESKGAFCGVGGVAYVDKTTPFFPWPLIAIHELMHVEECAFEYGNLGLMEFLTTLKQHILSDLTYKKVHNIEENTVVDYGRNLHVGKRTFAAGDLAVFYNQLEKKHKNLAEAVLSPESMEYLTGFKASLFRRFKDVFVDENIFENTESKCVTNSNTSCDEDTQVRLFLEKAFFSTTNNDEIFRKAHNLFVRDPKVDQIVLVLQFAIQSQSSLLQWRALDFISTNLVGFMGKEGGVGGIIEVVQSGMKSPYKGAQKISLEILRSLILKDDELIVEDDEIEEIIRVAEVGMKSENSLVREEALRLHEYLIAKGYDQSAHPDP